MTALDVEYASLVAKLTEKVGAVAAKPMLDALESLYGSDPAKKLEQLRQAAATVVPTTPEAVHGAPKVEALKPEPPAKPAEQKPEPKRVSEETRQRAAANWKRGAVRAAWEPRKRGHSKQTEVQGVFTMFPRYANAAVRAAMSKTVLLAYLACLDEADLDGRFEMPAGQLGERIGCNRRNAQRALDALLSAKLLTIYLPGGPKTPNVYGLKPWRDFDADAAIKALNEHREAGSKDCARAVAAEARRKAEGVVLTTM
jgi:hypothetical protein